MRAPEQRNLTKRSALILAAANAVGFVLVVLVIELTFGEWFSPYYPPSGAIFDRTYQFEQHLYRPFGVVTYKRDKYGLRGVRVPLEQVELVTVGGSTTDQRFISEGETWQDVVQTLTGIRIANAGDDGMSSTGHVAAVTGWLHRLPDFHPRTYLYYVGVNDALLAAMPQNAEAVRHGELTQHTISRTIRGRSALWQAGARLVAYFEGPPPVFQTDQRGSGSPGPEIRAKADRAAIRNFIERVYKVNLLHLFQLHRQRGESVILVSQLMRPSMARRDGDTIWVRSPGVASFAVALAMTNDATERICAEHATECRFIALHARLKLDDSDFYDLVHTTPSGARKIGEFLAKELLPIVRPSASEPAPQTPTRLPR